MSWVMEEGNFFTLCVQFDCTMLITYFYRDMCFIGSGCKKSGEGGKEMNEVWMNASPQWKEN